MTITERQARMALCALHVAADARLADLVDSYGPQQLWQQIQAQPDTALGRRAQSVDVEQLDSATQQVGATFLIPGDEHWPTGLADLSYARVADQGGLPMGLWALGDLDCLTQPCSVSMVGARAATNYGTNVAQGMAAELALSGWQIVSGLAYGIDAAAHRGALAVGRSTVAVMATGIDVTYPTGHQQLRSQIEAHGVVVTEMAPGTRPLRASFLGRNRLIAAMGLGTLVVEAGARSGARNTAAWASELGRVVAAVPGPVTSTQSVTPHYLIREGIATLVASAEQMISLVAPLGTQPELPLRGQDRPIDSLPAQLRLVRESMPSKAAMNLTDLVAATGLSVPDVLAATAELMELGWLEESAQGWQLPARR